MFDGEVQPECIAFAGGGRIPSQRLQVGTDDLREPVGGRRVGAVGHAAVGLQAIQQPCAAVELAGTQGPGVLQVTLQVVARAGRGALGVEQVGDVGDRHGGDHHHPLPGAGDGHVEAALAAGLAEHAEVAPEGALRVAAEGGGKHDDVALVALHVFHVLDEDRHVLAVFAALAFLGECGAEGGILPGALFQVFLDQLGLLAVEGDHAHRGAHGIGLLPHLGQVLHHPRRLGRVALVLVHAVDLDQLQRLDPRDAAARMAYRHVEAVAVEGRIGEADQFAVRRAVVDLQRGAGQGIAGQLQQVRAILDFAPVPGFLEGVALLGIDLGIGLVAIEDLCFIAFHPAGEEGGGRHLLLITADDRDPATEERGQRELDRHLRGLVVDHRVEQPRLQWQHAAGHVRVHQPDRAQVHQAQFAAQLDELAQAARTAPGQPGDVFPLFAVAQLLQVDVGAQHLAVEPPHLLVGSCQAGDLGLGFILAELQRRVRLLHAVLPAQPCFAMQQAAHGRLQRVGGKSIQLRLQLAQQCQQFEVCA